jgi:hypothetical protein
VQIVREHVTAGRSFASLEELNGAFTAWLPTRRGQIHRTYGEVIAVRGDADRAALAALPAVPYLVADRHLRRVGKDCLVSFEASLYSLPATAVRAGQRVEVRAGTDSRTVNLGRGVMVAAGRGPSRRAPRAAYHTRPGGSSVGAK